MRQIGRLEWQQHSEDATPYSPSLGGKYSEHGPRMERSAELSRSIFVCVSHQSLSRLVGSSVARSAEISRSIFVCASERDWCGVAWRGVLRSRGVYLSVPRRETGAE